MRARGGIAAAAVVAARAGIASAALAAGCATFEDPTIVLDLRVVGMTADPPEQVLDIDLDDPPGPQAPLELLEQLVPTRVCGYVADPAAARDLHLTMSACLPDNDLRCDPAFPILSLGDGVLRDPEQTAKGGRLCVLIKYDVNPAGWLALVTSALERDPTRGLAGVDYAIELRVSDPASDPASDVFAVKQARISPRFPDTKVANRNPVIAELQVAVNNGSTRPAPEHRCADREARPRLTVSPGDVVTLFPLEPPEGAAVPAREEFTVPTLDGGFETFTEVLSYQWLAGAGRIADPVTGGPPDIFGNQTLLGTEWTAPEVDRAISVPIWMIQRDERLGVAVYETCIEVDP